MTHGPLRWQVPNKALQLLEQYSKESRSLWFDIKACSRSRLFMSTLLLSETRFPGQSWVKRVVSVPAKQQASTWKIWVFSPNGVIRHHRCRVLTAIPKYRYSYWPGFGVATQRPGCSKSGGAWRLAGESALVVSWRWLLASGETSRLNDCLKQIVQTTFFICFF